jgi:hypothetical protein
MEGEIRKIPIGRLRVIYLFTWSILATVLIHKNFSINSALLIRAQKGEGQ